MLQAIVTGECRQCVVEPEVKCQLAALCQTVGCRSTLTLCCEVGSLSEGEKRRLWLVTCLCEGLAALKVNF